MSKVLTVILALIMSTGFSIVSSVTTLSWLAGHWVQEEVNGWAEESWTPPRGGTMLGTGLTGKDSKARSFEFMRIAESPQDGRPVFWGSPGGRAPVPFPMVKQALYEVVFENPTHDYPTRISYRRDGKMLIATTSGPGGSNPQTWRYKRR